MYIQSQLSYFIVGYIEYSFILAAFDGLGGPARLLQLPSKKKKEKHAPPLSSKTSWVRG